MFRIDKLWKVVAVTVLGLLGCIVFAGLLGYADRQIQMSDDTAKAAASPRTEPSSNQAKRR